MDEGEPGPQPEPEGPDGAPAEGEARGRGGPRPPDSEEGPDGAPAEGEEPGPQPERDGPDGALAECQERLKRSLADYANLERRAESEISSRIEDGVNSVVSDMLSVRDDFVRARDAYSAEGAPTGGLDSVLKNMDALLEGRGVAPIEALGGPFDPNLHEAVSSAPRPDLPEGTVVEEVRRGYKSRNRIIRPTLAIISTKEG